MSLFSRSLADGARLDLEGVALRLKVNRQARRVSLRIDARTGEAVATAPSARRLSDALAFARTRRGWLVERLAAREAGPRLEGGPIALFGVSCPLTPDGRRTRLSWTDDGRPSGIAGCGDGEVDPQLVVRAVRRAALMVFESRARLHCAELGVTPPQVLTADARTRWGSCTQPRPGRGASVRISWRLALAPFAVADYVVAHECAHLIEANHGPRFWALVRTLVGDPSAPRAFLRREGGRLHAFGR